MIKPGSESSTRLKTIIITRKGALINIPLYRIGNSTIKYLVETIWLAGDSYLLWTNLETSKKGPPCSVSSWHRIFLVPTIQYFRTVQFMKAYRSLKRSLRINRPWALEDPSLDLGVVLYKVYRARAAILGISSKFCYVLVQYKCFERV